MVDGGGGAVPAVTRPSFASAAIMTYGTNVLVAALSFVNVFVVARSLGPAGRGEVAFLTTMGTLTAALCTVGVEQAHANLAVRPELRQRLATNAVAFAILFGALGAAAVAVLIALFPEVAADSDPALRWLVLAALPVFILYAYLDLMVRADYAVNVANAAWLIPSVVSVAINGSLAVVGALTVELAVGTWVAGQLLGALALLVYVARRSGFGRPDLALARSALGFGVRSHIGRVMTLGNYRLDQWILAGIAGAYELGLYSVAVAWAEALFFLPAAFALVQRPDLVRATRDAAASAAARVFRVAVLLTAPLALLLILAAPILCVTTFGEGFRGSIDDLRVLALGGFGYIALRLLGNALTAQSRPLLAGSGVAVAFAATTALDLLLIPDHGGVGAAIASTVGYAAGAVTIAVVFSRAMNRSLRELVPRPGDATDLARRLSRLRRP
jgi:O-antigen/teichoic acid export membrane protein